MMRMTTRVAASAVLVMLSTALAQAQVCIDFDPFCDGLELTITGNRITGIWRNANGCDGDDFPVVGVIRDGIDNPCGLDVGRVGIACEARFGCEIFGDEWYWVLDGERTHWDLGNSNGGGLDPPGACWLDNIQYHVILGPCPFSQERSGRSLLSTLQAGR